MIEVIPAVELGQNSRRTIAEIYSDAFRDDFAYFSKDLGVLADAFEHMMVPELFYVALIDGTPAGITACTDGRQQCVTLDGRQLRRHFGLVKGSIASAVFAREFSTAVPNMTPSSASLEFVGTAAAYRGRGVAKAILHHLLALPQYDDYRLEYISDINAPALGLYTKLGFTEYRRKKVRHTRMTGINHYISMKLVQS
ncbi:MULTISPECIES: GNAT family N-acetyltransferase [Actinoalloteichus]|uniref:Acetyltransferase (GNAT) family protein n=1 Tax=Actinoalloteichus fjordicus TaxID=1612552 RepID=A0AAC9L8V9_9PSEU|nr:MULTISPECIES: GNAT family N-acetyltransferase [Actinoalloteichus]APU13051.1 acetyltransferase (GNAT) family protein [Actinoalloteichus fjordicus]APU19024.1 acetyltransferase (GNAT) family protein [Actinoalloteichus sp. GBA129-24]